MRGSRRLKLEGLSGDNANRLWLGRAFHFYAEVKRKMKQVFVFCIGLIWLRKLCCGTRKRSSGNWWSAAAFLCGV